MQLLIALLACLAYMLLVLHAGPCESNTMWLWWWFIFLGCPNGCSSCCSNGCVFVLIGTDKGNLEDSLAFGVSLCLNLSLLLGLCLIMDYPETPDNLFDPEPVFPVELVGVVLIVINVLPFLYFFYASAVIVKYGPLHGMRFGTTTPEHQKVQVQENITQRKRQRRPQKSLSMAHIQKVVDTDKVDKLKENHAKHRMAAINKIKAREKQADSRVRQRLKDRRKKKLEQLEHEKKKSTKVVPVATRRDGFDASKAATVPVNVPASAAVAAAVSSIPVGRIMAQKDIDEIRQTIHDKIGNVQKLQMIFGKLDQDQTGSLSVHEFKRLIASVSKTPPTKTVFKAIWQDVCQLRKAGNGTTEIDFDTFKAWLDFL
jgi:hypothetical protein